MLNFVCKSNWKFLWKVANILLFGTFLIAVTCDTLSENVCTVSLVEGVLVVVIVDDDDDVFIVSRTDCLFIVWIRVQSTHEIGRSNVNSKEGVQEYKIHCLPKTKWKKNQSNSYFGVSSKGW